MPKQPIHPNGRSKFRLLFIDGDLAPGELQDLTQAIAGAMRPTHMLSAGPRPIQIAGGTQAPKADEVVEEEELASASLVEQESTPGAPARPARERKYRSPNVVNDLRMDAGGKAFGEFAREKGNPEEHTKRFLLAATWLKHFANLPTVSVDHIFTCYHAVDWRFDIPDPGQPFRKLKSQRLGDTSDGKFTINHIGVARVEKMGEQSPA